LSFDPQGDAFPPTRYSVVAGVQSDDPGRRSRALDALAAAYWKPVYKYLRLRWQMDPEDARDLTQEFFARLIEKDFLDSYDPARGRLRTFLRTCADRLFLNQARDARRLKRGSGALVALDFDQAEHELAAVAQTESPEDYFEKEWVRTVFAMAVDRLRRQCQTAGKIVHFELFEHYDLAESVPARSYADLGRDFGLATTDVTNYLAFARREFRRCVLDQLREMTGSDDEFRREAHSLLGVDAP
jgi:RNA polymerase sigma factor (sigma-70 family)